MADNVAITPGTGVQIATDDVGGVQYQVVKLATGGDGVANFAPGDSSNGLDVDVTRLPSLPAGSNLVGAVGLGPAWPTGMNVYAVTVTASAVASLKNHLSLFNAHASLKVDVLRAYVTKEVTAAVVGLVRGFRCFRFTSVHTLGTVVSPARYDTTMGSLDAAITARVGATVTGAEAVALSVLGLGEEETATSGGRMDLFDWRDAMYPVTLNQNEGITVQQDATVGVGLVSVGIVFRVR